MSCFNSINALGDLVVSYIGAEFGWQWVTVCNDTREKMLGLLKN